MLLAVATMILPRRPHRRLAICGPRHAKPLPAMVVLGAVTAASVLPAPALLAGAMVLAVVIGRAMRRRSDRRRLAEGRDIAAALEVLIGELRIGAHPVSAFTTAASESSGRVSDSLRGVAARAQLGADAAEAIRAGATASPVPAYWNRLAVFWELAAEHGLAVSVLMRTAHRDIVDRQRFADRTHAALAGARATAAILASLPVLGVLLGELIGAQPVRFLFGGGVGAVLLIIGVGLIGAGLLWADRIIDRLAI